MKKIAYFLMYLANKIMAKNHDPSWSTKQEMECAKEGHIWTTFNNSNAPKRISERTYCRRCGQMYHEHHYINNVD